MLPFVCGFIVVLVLAVFLLGIIFRSSVLRMRKDKNTNTRQLEELTRLTGGLAHEIKNPLSTIKINLQLIYEDIDATNPENTRLVRKIAVVQKETERLQQTLDTFLRYIGRFELSRVPTNINELISEMVDFFTPQAQTRKITIRLGLDTEPIICNIDANMVKQVILNIFINACQAMSDGGELIVKTDIADCSAVIDISDTGPGIEPQVVDKIFDAYYTSKPGGSGLGLPTARKIIAAHNGSITVNSQLGKGTSFTIKLPLAAE